jgi:hypothetical protein
MMLLVVIAALTVALVVERRRTAALLADREQARQAAGLRDYYSHLFSAPAGTRAEPLNPARSKP